ncbi:MAG: hypothetical protein [Caudoviricetes sp.]|nr:MAG: hypothetical protein [Caudoviricetes sp.]
MSIEGIYKGTLELFKHIFSTDWGAITGGGVLTAIIINMLKMINNKETIRFIESILCGVFTLLGALILKWLDTPEYLGIVLGGGVGWYGTAKVSEWLEIRIGLKVRGDKDEVN